MLETLESWVQGNDPITAALLQPDVTVWFDLPPAVAATRLVGARVPDKFESQPEAFFEQVASGYARRQQSAPARFARINADQTPDAVRQEVLQALYQRGWLTP